MRWIVAVMVVLVAACGSGDDGVSPLPPDGGKREDVFAPPPQDGGVLGDAASEGTPDVTGETGSDAIRDVSADPTEGGPADATPAWDARDAGSPDGAIDAFVDSEPIDGERTDTGPDTTSTDAGNDAGGPSTGLWLKGDMHVHSNHSTDAMDTTVAEAFAKAESLGFDYFVLTDHDNHVEGKISTWGDPDYRSDKMVLLYGAEWTTDKGHANVFGTKPYDYAPIWAARDGDVGTSIATAHAQGLHFSVNHPAAKDLWEGGFELDFDSMEVWTAPFVFPDSNSNAIAKWDELLGGGRRLGVRGGSDSHHQHDLESTLFNIGNPTTWICARAKTGEALLEALKAGHVSVSYAATAERLDFTADVDGDGAYETIVGDNVMPQGDKAIRFKIEIAGFRATSTYNLTVFKNGTSFKNWQLTTSSVTFEDTPVAGQRAYYRVELRGPTTDAPILSGVAFGDFIALTNPIYVAFP